MLMVEVGMLQNNEVSKILNTLTLALASVALSGSALADVLTGGGGSCVLGNAGLATDVTGPAIIRLERSQALGALAFAYFCGQKINWNLV